MMFGTKGDGGKQGRTDGRTDRQMGRDGRGGGSLLFACNAFAFIIVLFEPPLTSAAPVSYSLPSPVPLQA